MSNVNNTIAGAGTIGGVAVVNSGTINANTVSTLFLNASTINAGKLEATASGGTLLLGANISNTGTGTILASGSGAHVVLNGAVISGGKLQTQAGGEIDVINGLLSGATIASGSIVDINNNGTLALSGRIANSGLISALGSPFCDARDLWRGGAQRRRQGVAVAEREQSDCCCHPRRDLEQRQQHDRRRLHNGFGGGLAVVNAGKLEATRAAARSGCRQHQRYRHWHYFGLGQRRASCLNGAVISGGKLQTQAGGEIDVTNGLLSGVDDSVGLDR